MPKGKAATNELVVVMTIMLMVLISVFSVLIGRDVYQVKLRIEAMQPCAVEGKKP